MHLTSVTVASTLLALLGSGRLAVFAAPGPNANALAIAAAMPAAAAAAVPAAGITAVDSPLNKRAALPGDTDDGGDDDKDDDDDDNDDNDDNDDDNDDVKDDDNNAAAAVAPPSRKLMARQGKKGGKSSKNLIRCQNNARIKSNKTKFGSMCQKRNSIGVLSSHNCGNRGGKSYLCVIDGVVHCKGGKMSKLRMENGECFA